MKGIGFKYNGLTEINLGFGKVSLLNKQGESGFEEDDIPTTCRFKVEIDGIDSNMIKSISIPKLSYETCDIFSVDVNIFPFKFFS